MRRRRKGAVSEPSNRRTMDWKSVYLLLPLEVVQLRGYPHMGPREAPKERQRNTARLTNEVGWNPQADAAPPACGNSSFWC